MSIEVWFGVRGGVGVTTCVAQRARALGRCLTIDLDVARGDLAERFDLRPTATVASLASAIPGELGVTDVSAIATDAGRVRVIASPAQPELVDFVGEDLVADLLGHAQREGPVVVDVGCHFDVVALAAFAAADRVVFVARADAACARQLGRMLDLCDRASISAELRLAVPRSSAGAAERFAHSAGIAAMPTPSRLSETIGRFVASLRNGGPAVRPASGTADVRL